MKRTFSYLILVIFCFSAVYVFAANQVVVIPLSSKRKSNVITVAKSGGDFSDPVAAVNSITDAASDNPYLIAIGPGEYPLSESLIMKNFVNIAGTGEANTKLTGTFSTASRTSSAAVVGATATLSDLTIENLGGNNAYSVGIYNNASLSVRSVTINVTNTADNSETSAIYTTAYSKFIDVTVDAYGPNSLNTYAIYSNGTVAMNAITATARGGVSCYGIRTGYFAPILTNVTVTATDASYCYGMYNDHLNFGAVMKDITATATGFYRNYGIYNDLTQTFTLTNVEATASNVTALSNYGIYNLASAPTISRSKMSGSTWGLITDGNGSTKVTNVNQSSIAGNGAAGTINGGSNNCYLSDNGSGQTLTAGCSAP